MLVTLAEMKNYLRVDHDEDDMLITNTIQAAEKLCMDIARVESEDEYLTVFDTGRIAVLYAVAYLYEHREEADHHALVLSLRDLLFGERRPAF
jgi:uncharacterized phage protein (predicted DNA packaging)